MCKVHQKCYLLFIFRLTLLGTYNLIYCIAFFMLLLQMQNNSLLLLIVLGYLNTFPIGISGNIYMRLPVVSAQTTKDQRTISLHFSQVLWKIVKKTKLDSQFSYHKNKPYIQTTLWLILLVRRDSTHWEELTLGISKNFWNKAQFSQCYLYSGKCKLKWANDNYFLSKNLSQKFAWKCPVIKIYWIVKRQIKIISFIRS